MVCVCVCLWVCEYVCVYAKTKTRDRSDFKLGTIVVLETVLKLIYFGFHEVNGQGNKVIISNFWHQLPSGE